MRKTLFILLFSALPLGAQNYSLPNTNSGFPATARQITWSTGSDIWNSGTLPTYTGVSCSATCNGSTDTTSQINSCISSASSGQAVVLPAGICVVNGTVRLKSNMALRGAKPQGGTPFLPTADGAATTLKLGASAYMTTQNFSFSGGNLTPATSYSVFPSTYTLSGSPQKGDTTVTIGSGSVSVGTWIEVYGNDTPTFINSTGSDGLCQWCGNATGYYVMMQIVQVTGFVSGSGGAGSVANISKALYFTPDTTARTVNGHTEPAGAKYTIISFPTVKAGYENLRFDASSADMGSTPIIDMQGCNECWVKAVETYDTGSSSGSAHVRLEWSYGNEVRDSYLHDQRSGASGAGYGVHVYFANGDHKIENNIIRHNRHSIVFEGGGAGDSVLYNYMDDQYTDDLTYLGSARSNHGAHPVFQLYEGNIISSIGADDFWGTSSHAVFFRNWIRGGEPNFNLGTGTIPSFPPNSGFVAENTWDLNNYYSYVDNVFGNGGLGSGISGTWSSATVSGNNPYASPGSPIVYSTGGSSGSVVAPTATIIRQANYDYKTLGVAFNDGGNCGGTCTYQASYYYGAAPSFMGSCTFPAQGSDLTAKGSLQQPAYQRAIGGACSGLTVATPTYSPTSLSAPGFVTIASTTANSVIHYTVDGSTPTTSSPVASHPVYVAASQTLKALASATGLITSAVATQAYTPTVPLPKNSLSVTTPNITANPVPQVMISCCTNDWNDIETARGTYSFTAQNAWTAKAASLGAEFMYVFSRVPSWANGGQGTAVPPTDISTSGTCQAPLAGVVTTDCQVKEFVTKYMQNDCGVSSQPANPLIGVCKTKHWVSWNEFNADGFWSGTDAQLAIIANDASRIVKAYSGDTIVYAGTVSAGGDGFHSNGQPGTWTTALQDFIQAWGGISGASLPDAAAYHAYPSRTTVAPVPFPTSLVSHSDSLCTQANTPNVSCRTAIKDQTTVAKSSTVIQNASTVAWSKYLPVLSTEGGWGLLSGLCATSCDYTTDPNTAVLRNAYVSQYMLVLAAQGTPQTLWYEYAQDCNWGIMINSGCSGMANPPAANAPFPWLTAYQQTAAWLNSATVIGSLTSTAVSGGNVWTIPVTIGGNSNQIQWFDGWLTTTNQSTSYTSATTLQGVTSPTSGTVTLGMEPKLLSNTGTPAAPSLTGTATLTGQVQ